MNDIVIQTEQLTKRFGAFTAVDHISFEVRKGEIFGFLGANGAGKTTAMRMLCGLSKPTSGKGMVAGFDVALQSEQVKKNIGYMSQKFSLYEDLKVWENIRLFAGIYGMKDKEIAYKTELLLERLEFSEERNTLVRRLPLGWKQKLAFSVSIFHEPKIVFLDEPTGGVDPATRRQFWELIYQAADRGITIFVTTHYMDEAERCHRLGYLAYGQLLAYGTVSEVIRTVGLTTWMVKGPRLAELAGRLRKEPAVAHVAAFGEALHVSGTDAAALEKALKAHRSEAYVWSQVDTSLEDVFIHLMGEARDNFS